MTDFDLEVMKDGNLDGGGGEGVTVAALGRVLAGVGIVVEVTVVALGFDVVPTSESESESESEDDEEESELSTAFPFPFPFFPLLDPLLELELECELELELELDPELLDDSSPESTSIPSPPSLLLSLPLEAEYDAALLLLFLVLGF
jgi:hypothetical protein